MISRLVIACLTRVRTHRAFGVVGGLVLACCMGVVAMLGVGAGVASAAETYGALCGGSPPAFCQSAYPWAFMVAVDNSSTSTAGDVYMSKLGIEGNAGVFRFTAHGDAAAFSGLNANIVGNEITFPGDNVGPVGVAVDTAGNLYVTDREGESVDVFSATGELESSFHVPAGVIATGIAVDNTKGPSKGDIYIASEAGGVIDKLSPSGTLIKSSTVEGAHPLTPYELATDSSGHVYAANHAAGGVTQKFSEELAFEGTVGEPGSFSVAVDPSTDDVFVAYADGQVQQYDSTGATIGSPFGALNEPYGIAVSGVEGSTDHFVYAAELAAQKGEIFGSGEGPVKPETGTVEVAGTTATFHGTLNPEGKVGESGYHFAYAPGASCKAGGVTSTQTAAEAKELLVEDKAESLAPKTEYSFCLVATNLFGSAFGDPVSFKTGAGAPVIETQSASEVMFDAAKVSATINPSGSPTTCVVKYGLAPDEKEAACPAGLGEGTAGVPTSVTLTGLEADKEYHYHFIAENPVSAGKPVEGADQTFTTEALTIPTTEAASEIGPETVKANGKIKPNVATKYYFAYGPTGEGLKERTPEHELPAGPETSVADTIAGLTPHKSYEVKLVTVTVADKTEIVAGIQAFETKVALPVITNAPPSVTRTTATISGEVNTEEGTVAYAIQYGTTTAYATGVTPSTQLEAATLPTAIEHVLLSELKAGTTYHYRIVATNESGTTNGPDATFTTGTPQPPTAFTGEALNITGTSATITAGVNPDGLPTSYTFEVGSEIAPGQVSYTPTYGTAGNGSEGAALSLGLTGLQPGTTYHYRITAHNEDGTATGAEQTFTTSGFTASILAPAPVTLIPYTAPAEPPVGKGVTVKSLTRAQKLTKALKQCRKQPKRKRAACIKSARKHYGPLHKKSTKRGTR